MLSVHCLFNTCPHFTFTTEVPILGFSESLLQVVWAMLFCMPYFGNMWLKNDSGSWRPRTWENNSLLDLARKLAAINYKNMLLVFSLYRMHVQASASLIFYKKNCTFCMFSYLTTSNIYFIKDLYIKEQTRRKQQVIDSFNLRSLVWIYFYFIFHISPFLPQLIQSWFHTVPQTGTHDNMGTVWFSG